MEYHDLYQNRERTFRHPYDPRGGCEGPSRFALQINAASRLAPTESFRGHTALLLYCGDRVGLSRAEEALRGFWPLDTVHAVQCPIESWGAALHDAPGTTFLLQHYVMREIQQRAPTLAAILDRVDEQQTADVAALVALLRRWGAASPIVVLQVRPHEVVESIVIPSELLRDTECRVPPSISSGSRI